MALEDPAREEVPSAIKSCLKAGVRVIMVTGDFSLTAQAIAKDIGILTSEPDQDHLNRVVSGDEISRVLMEQQNNPTVAPEDVENKVISWIEQLVRK